MIKTKIILDKRGIWNKKIITLILVIFVVASVFIFLFKTDINNYLRNLPGYSVPEEDEEINVGDDEEPENGKPEEEILIFVECESDNVCENIGYEYCVNGHCESGQNGSLCENVGDCDEGTCVKRQQCYPDEGCLSDEEIKNYDLGFCGYATHSNCEEFRGDGKDMCYCESCNCGYYEINVGQAEEMSDGTKWICNDIFEHIMPQPGFLAPCYYADECESGDMTSNTFKLKYGGEIFYPNRCL